MLATVLYDGNHRIINRGLKKVLAQVRHWLRRERSAERSSVICSTLV